MIIIGLTGGIGSGKSVISRLLINKGYPVYDSDNEAKRLCNESKELIEELIREFGSELYENGLNRAAFANIIFKNKSALEKANRIIHPYVISDFLNWTKNQSSSFVFIESAILFESNLKNLINKSIVVTAPQEIRIERVIKRNKTSREDAVRRIQNQMEEDTLLHKVDFIIQNDNKKAIIPQLEKILSFFQ
jgi:dephospho-CoA kinase